MSDDANIKRVVLNREKLPKYYPTHRHESNFWEHLGRVVATFGFLEETLAKAIFALTGTKAYASEEEAIANYEKWILLLENTLKDPLSNLSEKYVSVAKAHQSLKPDDIEYIEYIGNNIKKACKVRNALCHGSWSPPNPDGKSTPFFIDRKLNKYEGQIDSEYLIYLQGYVAELACSVMDSITTMGWQFPGSSGPGRPLLDGDKIK